MLPSINAKIESLKTELESTQNDRTSIRQDSAKFLAKLKPRVEKKKERKRTYESCLRTHYQKYGEKSVNDYTGQIAELSKELMKAQTELKSMTDRMESEKLKMAKFEVEESKLKDVRDYITKYEKKNEAKNQLLELKTIMEEQGIVELEQARKECAKVRESLDEQNITIVSLKAKREEKTRHIAQEKESFDRQTPDEAKDLYKEGICQVQ